MATHTQTFAVLLLLAAACSPGNTASSSPTRASAATNAPKFSTMPRLGTLAPPPQAEGISYMPEAAVAIQSAMEHAASAMDRNDFAAAIAELESEKLPMRSGVVVERYLAQRLEARPAEITHLGATKMIDALFDETYAIGRPGRRGVRMGLIAASGEVGAMFARGSDWEEFQRTRVVSLMETWIRVWQDVVGIQPISARTGAFLTASKDRHAWSDVDALATMQELGVVVPDAVLGNRRFPRWAGYAAWARDKGWDKG